MWDRWSGSERGSGDRQDRRDPRPITLGDTWLKNVNNGRWRRPAIKVAAVMRRWKSRRWEKRGRKGLDRTDAWRSAVWATIGQEALIHSTRNACPYRYVAIFCWRADKARDLVWRLLNKRASTPTQVGPQQTKLPSTASPDTGAHKIYQIFIRPAEGVARSSVDSCSPVARQMAGKQSGTKMPRFYTRTERADTERSCCGLWLKRSGNVGCLRSRRTSVDWLHLNFVFD